MFLDIISKKYRYRYLFSSNFNNLCLALDFLPEDIDEIKQKTYNLDNESDIEKSIALIIYDQILKNKKNPKKETHDKSRYYRRLSDYKGSSQVEFFYQVYIKDKNRWEDIRNKIEVGIDSGKINNDYLFEKECSHELELISKNDVDNALDTIYLHEIQYLINSHNLNEDVGDYIFKDACLEHYANPLYFDSVKKKFEETLEFVETEPAIEVKNWDIITLWLSYLIVDNEKLATFIDEFIDRTDEIYDADESRYLFTFPSYLGLEMVFYVITCGYDRSYKYRFDFSNIFIIKKGLIEDSNSLLVHQNSKLAQHFEDYIEEDFKKCRDINLKKCETKLYDNFEVTTFRNSDDNKTWHIFDVLNKKSEKISDYNQEDLYEIASQKPLSKEFLQLISSLNFDIDFAYWIQNTAEDSDEVLYWINKKILEDMDYSRNILSADELLNKLDGLYTKTILKFKENKWDEIKESLISKISSGEIKSSYDLQFNFSQMLHSSFKINILNAQIEAILDFKELDYSYSEKLAFYLRDFDILDNGLCEYLNDLIPEKVEIIQKEYLDKAKFAAPKWLVYPELSATTIGWRMGYGEVYAINEPWPSEEFLKLFPKPKNWLFDKKSDFKRHPVLGSFWRDQGEQKYFEVICDAIEVNNFITIEQEDKEFRYNSKGFKSIEHAILTVKYDFFDKIDYYNTSFNTLKRGFELTEKEIEHWQNFRYSVLLNAAYYKFMQDENLKEKLLQTGDKSLVYISDDEWGGDENLFGFALMELRDEIRRLYKNEDCIDWEYTEYLKHKNPYG